MLETIDHDNNNVSDSPREDWLPDVEFKKTSSQCNASMISSGSVIDSQLLTSHVLNRYSSKISCILHLGIYHASWLIRWVSRGFGPVRLNISNLSGCTHLHHLLIMCITNSSVRGPKINRNMAPLSAP